MLTLNSACAGLQNRRRVVDDTGMDLKRAEARVGGLAVFLLLFLVLFLLLCGVHLLVDHHSPDSHETELGSVIQVVLAIVLLVASALKRLSAVLCPTAAIRRPGLQFAGFPTPELKLLVCFRI